MFINIAALALFALVNAGSVQAADSKRVLTGSSTVVPLALEIGKRFEARNPGVSPAAVAIANYAAFFWMRDRTGQLIEFGRAQPLFGAPVHPATAAYVQGERG
jgi:hypothetical protein